MRPSFVHPVASIRTQTRVYLIRFTPGESDGSFTTTQQTNRLLGRPVGEFLRVSAGTAGMFTVIDAHVGMLRTLIDIGGTEL